MAGSVLRHTLPQGIKHIQLDLQDLMGQVSSQVSLIFSQLLPESASSTQQPQFSPSSVDEEHSELQDEADSTSRKRNPEQQKPLQNSVGQSSGGLHHSEGSGPLPHQAGERLPPVGFQNPHEGFGSSEEIKKTWPAQNQNIPAGRNAEQRPEGKAALSLLQSLFILSCTLRDELLILMIFLGISHSFHLSSNGQNGESERKHLPTSCFLPVRLHSG